MQAAPDRKRSLLDTPILNAIIMNWQTIAIIALVILALTTRFYDLGTRALHHDESIHARWSWDLYQQGNSFRYDPTYHGPFLYYAVNLAFLLFGASDYTTRVAPAVFGVMLLLLPLLLRKQLGKAGVVATMFFILLSPSIMYYSRALRHDIFALWGTMVMVISIFRYLDERKSKWLYFFILGFSVSYASHELTFITGYILLAALALVVLYEYTKVWPVAVLGLFVFAAAPPISLPLALALVLLPVGAFFLLRIASAFRSDLAARLHAGPATSAIAGITANQYLLMILIWAAISVPLFTTMFNWLPGIGTATIGGIGYWLTQHGVARGAQPGYYYLFMLPLEEFLPLTLSFLAVIYYGVQRWRQRHVEAGLSDQQKVIVRYFPFFLFYWFLSSLIVYSWGGEKMPWLVIHIALPLCVIAGWFVGKLVDALDVQHIKDNGGLILALLIPLFMILFAAVLRQSPVFGGRALAEQAQTIQWLAMALILIALAGIIGWFWTRLGTKAVAQIFALDMIVIMSLFTVRTAWRASVTLGEIAKDPLIYVQSTRDVTNVVDRVTRLSRRLTSGDDIVVSYDDETSWPLTWYFRDFKNQKYEPKGPTTPPDAPVVMVGLANDDKVRPLMGNYDRVHLKQRSWFPEFYKSPDEASKTFLGPQAKQAVAANATPLQQISAWAKTFGDVLSSPTGRQRLWRFWLYRELWDPNTGKEVTEGQLGSTDFVVYTRKDLSDSFWSGGPVVTKSKAPSAEETSYQRATQVIPAVASFGSGRGTGAGQLADPKNVAVDTQGNVYVADTLNHRIQKFDASGKYLMAFGSAGEGDGQFNEPWGVAVDKDGNTYVADTWNHRIQKFDKDGKFVTKWGGGLVDTKGVANGQPGVFYGPRAVAVDRDGNLLVTDTGNKRIQKFDPTGKFLGQFGTVGTMDGQFNEPVGVAVDRNGNIYVADTWNHRIQKFSSDLKYLAQWPVLGWDSESIVNKPYLATDGDGNVYASDPEAHRILKFLPTGLISAVWGKLGSDASSFNLPVGVATDASANVYVADALNQRVQKFAPVK